MLALSTGSKRTGNIATGNEARAVNEVRRSVALIYYCIPSLKDVLQTLHSCCRFVIKSLDNLLIDMQTKCNIVILMQQPMYASIRKTVRIFDLEFLFSNFSCKDNTKTHIVIHILIGMFNGNPMIPQYLKLVEYSQRYSQLC